MKPISFRRRRFFYVCLAALGLVACGGGGDDKAARDPICNGSGSVTVSGKVQYEFVPAVETGLDFARSTFKPVRQAEVDAMCGTATYASTVTDEQGAYSLTVPENVDVVIRARAAMSKSGSPGWTVNVVDNTRNQATWAVQGGQFNSGTGNLTLDLRAESGWTGSSYTETRAAAPFAILDSVYTAMQRVLEADPAANFPALTLNWSPKNSTCSENDYPYAKGCIGTSFYGRFSGSAGRNIFILGDAEGGDADTDEFDNHVIIHEWGHYYEDAFSRSDSIGGSHRGGDALDPRVSFGEGWGNAWSAIATNNPLYVDTTGSAHNSGFTLNIEGSGSKPTGWWNEAAVQEIIYDLYDGVTEDGVDLNGFGPLHEALTTGQRGTEAMTTLFSFIYYLQEVIEDDAAFNALLAEHDISPIMDIWGDNRQPQDDGSTLTSKNVVDPVHTPIAVSNGAPTSICTTNTLMSDSEYNRLGVRRFLRFMPSDTGEWLVTLDTRHSSGDPDFHIYASGSQVTGGTAESTGDDDSSENGIETATVSLTAGTQYVIEVLDWLNADDNAGTGGDICLDLTFNLN